MLVGEVRGVGLRLSAADVAGRAGLSGWAANTADGRTEVVLQGDGDAVAGAYGELLRTLQARRVDVDLTEREELSPVDGEHGFSVRG